jgi:hypothetical protein
VIAAAGEKYRRLNRYATGDKLAVNRMIAAVINTNDGWV